MARFFHNKRPAAMVGGVSLLGIVALFLVGCGVSQVPVEKLQGATMGTTYHITYRVGQSQVGKTQVAQRVFASLQQVDERMSTYKTTSELMQLNRAPVNQWITVSPEVITIIARSQDFSRLSGGAYDITVGPLVNLWGFGPDKRTDKVPAQADIDRLLKEVGYHHLIIDSEHHRVLKKQPLFIDLSSIAKGYGVDQVAHTLERMHISNYLIEVGGEMRIAGEKSDHHPWIVGIEQPDAVGGTINAMIIAPGKGIATSGDYRNYFAVDGKRYSHTIDSRTGYPVTHHLASVTIIADTTEDADAMATMMMVLGEKAGLALANKQHIAAYFIYQQAGTFKTAMSLPFKPYLKQQINAS